MKQFENYKKFTDNKYLKVYHSISKKAIGKEKNDQTQSHHVLPKSLGGGNDTDNLINVDYRTHFMLHKLLTKFTTNKDKMKMCYAFHTFFNFLTWNGVVCQKINAKKTSRNYELNKRLMKSLNEYKTKSNLDDVTKFTLKNKTTKEVITGTRQELIKITNITNQEMYNLTTYKYRHAKNWGIFVDGSFTCDKKTKNFQRPKTTTCEYCKIELTKANHSKWHGEKCKLNPNKEHVVKETFTCGVCGKETTNKLVYHKHHGDRCKLKL